MAPRLFNPAHDGPEVRHPTPRQVRRRKRLRSRVTVGELVDLYLRHKRAVKGLEPRTLAQVESMLKGFVKYHGARPITDLEPFHVTEHIEANPKWKSNGTRARVADAINAVFNWAVKLGKIRRNPTATATYPGSDPREPMDDVSFERLCAAAPKELERITRFIRYVGCRPGEARQAMWEDMDLERCLWVVHKHKTRKRTRKPKTKVLPPAAIKLLTGLGPKPFGPVFPSRLGKPWSDTGSLDRAFHNLTSRVAGIPDGMTLHCLRHRFITAAAASGASVPAIAQQVGHDDLASTWRYIHMPTEMESVRNATLAAQPRV